MRTHQEVKGLRTEALELMEDVIVRLGQNGSRFLSFEIRLIRATSQVNGEVLTFLTNIYGVSAIEICDLYKKRWSIEVFFKFIKQELKAFSWVQQKHYYGYTVHDSHSFRFTNRVQETQWNGELQVR